MTYLYETIPALKGAEVAHYEFEQSINDLPLTKHPETGEPIRRVILGGGGSVTSKQGSGSASKGGCDCGPSGYC
jgi:predicted nucleic acid-binding Zn ribbon protein